MSLFLSGAKIATIAGTEMQCIEIYEGEAYTIPFQFTNSAGVPIDCTVPNAWVLGTNAKWYECNIAYTSGDLVNPTTENINISNLALISPQPSQPANLVANFSNAVIGTGYIYIPADIDGGEPLTVTDTSSLLTIVTMTVTREDIVSGLDNISREPLGFIIRYQ